MILITGAAGFIGSCMAVSLRMRGYSSLVLADDFGRADKSPNLTGLEGCLRVSRDELAAWLAAHAGTLSACIHLGARTDTAEADEAVFDRLNVSYSQMIWQVCARAGIPLIYASSAATYGDGSQGFDDDPALIPSLRPLNAYGRSKHLFDKWALTQAEAPPRWAGLKFFNVYGPNEYHKGRMASVIFHAARQIRDTGRLRLFRSHRPDYPDGGQMRDFIYVQDLLDVIAWMLAHPFPSGIYNLGTGQARTFYDLALSVFEGMEVPPVIEYIDIPADIRSSYQYYTQARMDRLRTVAGYPGHFTPLEAGVRTYVQAFLRPAKGYAGILAE
ncbi:MAG: ADP-glyceromanno-heptose 6-epimerase [Bacteroidia bacterium]|nr:ADP-glyceromanno-heptose 6-epimerase [Bacteroidia bacterium]